jgi:type II secretory pathway pseudopilin PulG
MGIKRRRRGFTLAEIIIIIAVLALLCTLGVVGYSMAQRRAQNARQIDDIKNVESLLEVYSSQHGGAYPATTSNIAANWKTVDVRTDANCFNGSQQDDWVPDLGVPLPQSTPNTGASHGVGGNAGCYLYASNGAQYVLSAWNMLSSPQSDKPLYRRLGFRAFQTSTSTQFYTCNDNVIGGANGGYDITSDYYKHSYTLSNITDCDETPPPGA